MLDELLDVQDVASRLKVNPRTVLRMAERGDLVAAKVARRWRFRMSDVDEYLQSQIEVKKAQGMDINKRELPLAVVKQRLEFEKQRLELQKEKLDLKTKRIDDALEMVDMLHPDVDADKKAELLQSLLQNLLRQLDPALPSV